jgi:hypothetical protein
MQLDDDQPTRLTCIVAFVSTIVDGRSHSSEEHAQSPKEQASHKNTSQSPEPRKESKRENR